MTFFHSLSEFDLQSGCNVQEIAYLLYNSQVIQQKQLNHALSNE
jgi:hypothetical protein